MTVVFIAGPYTAADPVVKRAHIARAREAAIALWNAGFVAICPHLNSGGLDGLVREADVVKGYQELVRRADAVLALSGWEQSKGARAEVALGVARGIPVLSSVADLEAARTP